MSLNILMKSGAAAGSRPSAFAFIAAAVMAM